MSKTKKIVLISVFASISAVLMSINFPLPIAPAFMKMDISELPIIIAGFILGPTCSIIIIILKILIKMFIKSTSTMGIGEIANFISSMSYILPTVIIYWHNKNKKNAIFALSIGTIISSIVSTITNAYLTFPLYINLFGISEEKIINMCKMILPSIDSMNKVFLMSVLPFNIIKYVIVSFVTVILYKHISNFIKQI